MAYATINPFTEEQVKTFPTTTDAEIETAIAKGDAAFQKWKNFSHADRARILQKAADLLRENLDEYSKLLTLEMGKRFAEAQAETELSAAIFEYYAKNAEKLLEPQDLPVADPQEGRAKLVRTAGDYRCD